MPVLESQIDAGSAEFRENKAGMDALEAELRERLGHARAGGGPEAVKRHREQGKLLARERSSVVLGSCTAGGAYGPRPRHLRRAERGDPRAALRRFPHVTAPARAR